MTSVENLIYKSKQIKNTTTTKGAMFKIIMISQINKMKFHFLLFVHEI